VKITDEALYQAARLSDRYVTDQFLPDKAIDLIDETAARIKLQSSLLPDDVRELMSNMENLDEQEHEAVAAQDYETAARLRDRKAELEEEIERLSGDQHLAGGGIHVDRDSHRTRPGGGNNTLGAHGGQYSRSAYRAGRRGAGDLPFDQAGVRRGEKPSPPGWSIHVPRANGSGKDRAI